MPSGEYLIPVEQRPYGDRLASINKQLEQRVRAHDFEIINLSYRQELDNLLLALQTGKEWATDRLSALETAVQEYVSANNAHRMDAFTTLKEQITGIRTEFQGRGKKAA
ncbi:MAG: hypothetical protein AAB974_03165 [Patescibacteria group bacterium]